MSRVLVVYRAVDEVGPYRDVVVAAGLDAVLARADEPVSLDGLDGLLLTGGEDVDPALYGEPRHPKTEDPDPERDTLETMLLREALDRDVPVLAICRGLQLLNVAHGGTLIQHLDDLGRHQTKPPDLGTPAHSISIKPGTLLYNIAGTDSWQVNSRHHQAVAKLGAGLNISAIDPADGTIEALERPDKQFALAVQWHPENQAPSDPAQFRLFQSFGAAVKERNHS